MQHADNLIYTLVLFLYMLRCEIKVTLHYITLLHDVSVPTYLSDYYIQLIIVCMYNCMYICMYLCMYEYMYVSMCVCAQFDFQNN